MTEETKQKLSDVIENLTEKAETLKTELMELEKEFNTKKEEFIKIQGALEAFQIAQSPNIIV